MSDPNDQTLRGGGPDEKRRGPDATDIAAALGRIDQRAEPPRKRPPTETDLVLRLATGDDLVAIAAIYNAAIATGASSSSVSPISVNEARAFLARSDPKRRPVLVAEARGRVIACIAVRDFHGRPAYNATAEIDWFVHPSRSNPRTERALLAGALERIDRAAVSNVVMLVFADDKRTIDTLSAAGFERWGRVPHAATTRDADRDVLLMGVALA